jgi:hypothetical protein
MQRVAGDPLPAVQQPAQISERTLDPDTAGGLDGERRAGLVGDRAGAADARGDVRWLTIGAPAEERLEESRWLVDVEPDFVDLVAGQPQVGSVTVAGPVAAEGTVTVASRRIGTIRTGSDAMCNSRLATLPNGIQGRSVRLLEPSTSSLAR